MFKNIDVNISFNETENTNITKIEKTEIQKDEYNIERSNVNIRDIETAILKTNHHITSTIKNMFEKNNFENMIIMGCKGIGKTIFLKWLIRKYILKKNKYLYLNYLDDKGIDMVRQKIKQFTELKFNSHKFIIIDDADDLSISAQQSLRRIMEKRKKKTTFIFTLNNFKNLIFPIHSRCILFELNQMDKEIIGIKNENENLNIKNDIVDEYRRLSYDDKYLYDTHKNILQKYKKNDPLKYIKNYNIKPTPWNIIRNEYL
jgi:replication factor C subunit 2/4